MTTEYRPRIKHETNQKLKEVKEQLEYLEREEGADINKFLNSRGDLTEDKIINRALTKLQEEGLIE